jgi:hypothetical protein
MANKSLVNKSLTNKNLNDVMLLQPQDLVAEKWVLGQFFWMVIVSRKRMIFYDMMIFIRHRIC